MRHLSNRRLFGVALASCLLAVLAPPVAAASSSHRAAAASAASFAALAAVPRTLPQDDSGRLPKTRRDEAVGDFLGAGYDQRALFEFISGQGPAVNIYDPPTKGSGRVMSIPVQIGFDNVFFGSQFNSAIQAADPLEVHGLSNNVLTWANGFFYLSGTIGAPPLRKNYVLRFPANFPVTTCPVQAGTQRITPDCLNQQAATGSWAKSDLPTDFNDVDDAEGGTVQRQIGVTSLAVGMVGTTEVLAIGLSDDEQKQYLARTIELVRTSSPTTIAESPGCGYPEFQAPVTAMAWDPGGSGLLTFGCINWSTYAYATKATVTSTGASFTPPTYFTQDSDSATLKPGPLTAAVAQQPGGPLVSAFGTMDGQVILLDLSQRTSTALAVATGLDPVTGLTFMPRTDGTVGLPDLMAVSSETNTNSAAVLRYSGTALTAEPLTPSGATEIDVGSAQAAFPGYKTGRINLTNRTSQPVTVAFASRPDPGYGCWFDPDFPVGVAFPTAPLQLGVGHTSTRYTIGGSTIGTNGSCGPTNDSTTQWAAYLVVTPTEHPADQLVVKLEIDRNDLKLSQTPEQVGGSLAVSAAFQAYDLSGAIGVWNLTITGSADYSVRTAPTVVAKQLTSAADPGAVYRFDISGAAFTVPPRVQTELQPLLVEMSNDLSFGDADDFSAYLVPRTALTLGTDGQTLTLGRASFWWEAALGFQYFRVSITDAQNGRLSSAVVDVETLTPAAAPTNVSGPVIAPITPDAIARPVNSGLDQAAVRVQVLNTSSQVLPTSNALYDRIYYRDDSGTMVTNLMFQGSEGVPADFTGVSQYAGAYATVTKSPIGPDYDYVSTTSTENQQIFGYVGGVLTGGAPTPTNPIQVLASSIAPVRSATTAAQGISLEGCSGDFTGSTTCKLAPLTATRPALFLNFDDDGNPLIGVLNATPATTSRVSLPLEQRAGLVEHRLASSPLTVTASAAVLQNTSMFWSSDMIDTTLVTHGLVVPVTGVTAGGGNG